MLLPARRTHKRAKRTQPIDAQPRLPGQPMKPVSQLKPSRRVIKQQQQAVSEQHQARMAADDPTLSSLERLPLEILQQIFFACLEVNLANTSRTFNQALTDDRVYKSVILFAYFRDDGLPVEKQHFRPAVYRELTLMDRCKLQCAISKCRWHNLDRIRVCLPILSRLAMVQAWHREQKDEVLRKASLPDQNEREQSPDIYGVAALPPLNDQAAMQEHFLATSDLEYYQKYSASSHPVLNAVGDRNFLPFVQTWQISDDESSVKYIAGARSVLNVLCISDRVVAGDPWTDEKLALLQLLRQGLRYKDTDPLLDISVVAVFKGMASAIRERNDTALLGLLELWDRVFLYGPSMHFDRYHCNFNLGDEWGRRQHSTKSYHPLPPSLFHLATKQGKSSTRLLALLVRASVASIPDDDPGLTSWALQARAADIELGSWLLHYFEQTEGQRHDLVSSPLSNGARAWRHRQGNEILPETSFTQEMGYIHERAQDEVPRSIKGFQCGGPSLKQVPLLATFLPEQEPPLQAES